MPTDVYRVDSYEFAESDALFLDTNIWLYVYARHRHRMIGQMTLFEMLDNA